MRLFSEVKSSVVQSMKTLRFKPPDVTDGEAEEVRHIPKVHQDAGDAAGLPWLRTWGFKTPQRSKHLPPKCFVPESLKNGAAARASGAPPCCQAGQTAHD